MPQEIADQTKLKVQKAIKIDDGVSIKVRSGFYGVLHFKNPRSGETFIWNHIGDIQFLSMGDLKTMKAQDVGYFKNQWISIIGVSDDSNCKAQPSDIYKALAIDVYYKNFIDPASFDAACNWDDREISEKVSMLTEGAKQNLIVALNSFIEDGTLDSRRKIKAFEKALDCELTIN